MILSKLQAHLGGHVDQSVINLISDDFEVLKKQKAILTGIIARDKKARKAIKNEQKPAVHGIEKICKAVSHHLMLSDRVYVFYKYASRGFTCRSKTPEAIDKLMDSDEHALVGAFVSAVKPSVILERVQLLTEEVRV